MNPRKSHIAILASAIVVLGIGVVVACSDSAITVCHNIPDGGCPAQEGVACQDPSCAAVYACLANGDWSFVNNCPAQDGSVQDTSIDAPTVNDAGYDIDAPPGAFGGPGCEQLESPDCPLGLVLLCQSGCCECEDLYVCDDGGWDPWGTCSDDAGITPL